MNARSLPAAGDVGISRRHSVYADAGWGV